MAYVCILNTAKIILTQIVAKMRRPFVITIFLLVVTVKPKHGVKIFLQKYAQGKDIVLRKIPYVVLTRSRDYTQSDNQNFKLQITSSDQEISQLPKSTYTAREKALFEKFKKYIQEVAAQVQRNNYSRLNKLNESATKLQLGRIVIDNKQTRKSKNVPIFQREPIDMKLDSATLCKKDRHYLFYRLKNISFDNFYPSTDNSYPYTKQGTNDIPKDGSPPRMLRSLADIFGFNVINMWNVIKDIFSMYFDTSYLSGLPTLPNKNVSTEAMDIKHLVEIAGYDLEEHEVTTTDGYILTMHRLAPREDPKPKRVVYLMHGLVDSSDSWILQGKGKALAYLLYDAGCDVWMGNARGNRYSMKHTTLYSNQSEFWRFSWEEIALYDLPPMIDYILQITERDKLYYIGHSQGTTCFFVLCSMKPEYNEKIEMMFALSPIAFMSHVKSPIIKLFSPAHELLNYWYTNLNIYGPISDAFQCIMEIICYLLPRCDSLLNMLVGGNFGYIDKELLPIVFSRIPTGSSTLQLIHYGQLVMSGRFSRYDYGSNVNLNVYGSEKPPDYKLYNIKLPIVLFYSNNDWLSSPEDVNLLISQLNDAIIAENIISDFNHLDFMFAKNAKQVIYMDIIKEIEAHDMI